MSKKKSKEIKRNIDPSGVKVPVAIGGQSNKTTNHLVNPDNYDKKTPSWAFSRCDVSGDWCIWRGEGKEFLADILPKLRTFEGLTWAMIKGDSKGHGIGSKSHHVDVDKLSREAQKRLVEELHIYEDQLFSLRLDGKKRIYGILDSGVLNILWYGSEHEIYQLK